jgi:hypothetical protein
MRKFIVLILSTLVLAPVPGLSQELTPGQKEELSLISRMTAKQTWWFFDLRLKHPLYRYHDFMVFLPVQAVWVKNITQQSSGNYTGSVATLAGQDHAATEPAVSFDSTEIDDWLFVDDDLIIGGFNARLQGLEDILRMQRAVNGYFRNEAINQDFIDESRVTPFCSESLPDYDLSNRFPGGDEGFSSYLSSHITYPYYAQYLGIQGQTTCRFLVLPSGEVSRILVVRSIGAGTSEQAKRTIGEMPVWLKADRPCWYTVPLSFKLR